MRVCLVVSCGVDECADDPLLNLASWLLAESGIGIPLCKWHLDPWLKLASGPWAKCCIGIPAI